MMRIDHLEVGTRFVVELPDGLAVLEYELVAPAVMDIQSTFVPEAARGRGIAAALVQTATAHARAAGWRIIPSCSYVAHWFSEHPEARDLLHEGQV